jgi:hypothetical protein
MSPTARRRLYRPFRRACLECRMQPARFRYRGRVRADRDHTLCFRCFRSEAQRQRAKRLAASFLAEADEDSPSPSVESEWASASSRTCGLSRLKGCRGKRHTAPKGVRDLAGVRCAAAVGCVDLGNPEVHAAALDRPLLRGCPS